jgi:hypothetical protein
MQVQQLDIKKFPYIKHQVREVVKVPLFASPNGLYIILFSYYLVTL